MNSVVNAASFQPAIASGGFVSIIGTGFPVPHVLDLIGFFGREICRSRSMACPSRSTATRRMSSTSARHRSTPSLRTTTRSGRLQVQVTTPQGASYAGTVLKQKLSPAFFTYQSGTTSYVAAVHLDGTLVGPTGPSSRPAVPGEVIEIYGTGFGPTNPASPTAQLVSQPPLSASQRRS